MREFIVTLTVERALKAQATAIYFSHPETLTERLLATPQNSTDTGKETDVVVQEQRFCRRV